MLETNLTARELENMFNGRTPFFEVEETDGGWRSLYDYDEIDEPRQVVLTINADEYRPRYFVDVREDGEIVSESEFASIEAAYAEYRRLAAFEGGVSGLFGSNLNTDEHDGIAEFADEFRGEGWYYVGYSDESMSWTNEGAVWCDSLRAFLELMNGANAAATEYHLPYAEYLGDGEQPAEQ